MAEQIHKSMVNYFIYVDKLYCTWQETIMGLVKPIVSVKNLSEQLRHVSSYSVDNAEVCRVDDARENLIFKINIGIDNEIITIDHDMQSLKNLYLDLKNKLHHLNTLKNKVSDSDPLMHELIKGTSYRAELSSLYEYAEQVHDYYRHFFNLINNNYIALNRYNEQTIQKLAASLEESSSKKSQVLKVLVLTEFMMKEKSIK